MAFPLALLPDAHAALTASVRALTGPPLCRCKYYYYNLLSDQALSLFHSFEGDTRKSELEKMTAEISALNLLPEEEVSIYRGFYSL